MTRRGSLLSPSTSNERGQLVLVAALALALALVTLGVAYLQLGYHDDISGTEQEPAQQLERTLDRAVHEAAADIPETYRWSERGRAVETFRDEVNTTIEALETSRVSDGHVYRITVNETHADQWVTENCPGDANRQFGGCDASDGVAIQERNDQTHVLAVAFDLTITTPDRETAVTIAVEIDAT